MIDSFRAQFSDRSASICACVCGSVASTLLLCAPGAFLEFVGEISLFLSEFCPLDRYKPCAVDERRAGSAVKDAVLAVKEHSKLVQE